MSGAETLRRAAERMRERAEAVPEQPRTEADVTGVWLHGRFHLTAAPEVVIATAQLLAAAASVLDAGDYTVESDAIPTWLHLEIDNLAHAYLRADA